MRKLFLFLFLTIFLIEISHSQTKTNGTIAPPQTIDFSDTSIPDFNPQLHSVDKQPIPASEYGDKKQVLHQRRMLQLKHSSEIKKKSANTNDVTPEILKQFEGNIASGAPSDNDIAISDSGTIISSVNSNIYVYSSTGNLILTKTLPQLITQLGSYTYTSDPRLIYDPTRDRFVMAFFSGSLSTSSVIFVGFSKTNNPAGAWNFYKLPGNSFNDSTWSDYPILALSGSDLFMTFNQVKDNVSWTIGFKQSVIWQIDLNPGFNGDSLRYTLWSDIKYQNRNLRNICPAKPQSKIRKDNMYFLSVRNVDYSNDSIFLLEITNSYNSGTAQLKQKVLKSPIKYGFPPNALQAKVSGKTQQLMTNDARVLAAIYENDYIHFGSNSIHPSYNNAGVFLATIKNVSQASPTMVAKIFAEPRKEYGYPSMAQIGDTTPRHRVLYTFSHCITDSFPGMSMVYQNTNGEFGDVIDIKKGASVINNFSDSIERWGDYSNAQKVYAQNQEAVLVGSWGQSNKMKTWIAKVGISDTVLPPPPPKPTSISNGSENSEITIYPNPFHNLLKIEFFLKSDEYLTFRILSLEGKLLHNLLYQKAFIGKNEFSFSPNSLASGNYILHIQGDDGFSVSKNFAKE